MALTKQDILKSVEDSKEVEIKSLKGKVLIRPLRDAEYSEIQDKIFGGIKATKSIDPSKLQKAKNADSDKAKAEILQNLGLDIDVAKIQKLEKESTYLACKYGLSVGDEEWTLEDVGKLPPGVPKEISEAVFEYTGVDKLDEVKKFRKGK